MAAILEMAAILKFRGLTFFYDKYLYQDWCLYHHLHDCFTYLPHSIFPIFFYHFSQLDKTSYNADFFLSKPLKQKALF